MMVPGSSYNYLFILKNSNNISEEVEVGEHTAHSELFLISKIGFQTSLGVEDLNYQLIRFYPQRLQMRQ